MVTEWIMRESQKSLIRYRAGKISLERCQQEMAMLLLMLKAYDATILEKRLTDLEESVARGGRGR